MSYSSFGTEATVPGMTPGWVGPQPKDLPPSCGTPKETQEMLNKLGYEVPVTGVMDLGTALGITAFALKEGFKEGDDPDAACRLLVEKSGGTGMLGTAGTTKIALVVAGAAVVVAIVWATRKK
jgi:hypothetical protein